VIIGRVIGDIVSTAKHPHTEGRKMQLVQPLTPDGTPRGNAIIALDTVSAAEGDMVLVVDEGNAAAQVLARERGAVRTLIVGVIDHLDMGW
jgi:ethanolamine utilization protein EutN